MPWFFLKNSHIKGNKNEIVFFKTYHIKSAGPTLGISEAGEEYIFGATFVKPSRNVMYRVVSREGDHAPLVCLKNESTISSKKVFRTLRDS